MTEPASKALPTWHQALAYALTGRRWPSLGRQAEPDVAALAAELDQRLPGGIAALREEVGRRRHGDAVWPFPLPADLAVGLGAARFLAVRTQLIEALGLLPAGPQQTVRAGPLTLQERRLVEDRPPHH